MGRKERPLDAAKGPVEAFAAELRKLRDAAGTPSYTDMAKTAHVSKTVLSEAAGGSHPPTWSTVKAYLLALGIVDAIEQNEWHERWSSMRAEHAGRAGEPAPTPSVLSSPGRSEKIGDPSQDQRRTRRRLPIVVVGGVVMISAVVLFATLRHGEASTMQPTPSTSARDLVGVVVSNKVAVGADALIEDSTPAYLSTDPVPYCAHRGCKVPGTEMSSGTVLDVTCVVEGAWMTNYDLDADVVKANPNRYSSSLWYRGTIAGGHVAGYLSEVYLAPEYRGGLGLPVCATTARPSSSG